MNISYADYKHCLPAVLPSHSPNLYIAKLEKAFLLTSFRAFIWKLGPHTSQIHVREDLCDKYM